MYCGKFKMMVGLLECVNCEESEKNPIDCCYISVDTKKTLDEQNIKKEQGRKFDDGKLPYDLIPPECLEELAKVLAYGAKKYSANNWQNVEPFNERYYSALMKHLENWRKGEQNDPESGLNHLSHVLANAVFLLWKELKNK